MHGFQRLTVALSRTAADAGTIRYAATVSRLGSAQEVRFVHVLPNPTASGQSGAHAEVEAELRAVVAAEFAAAPASVSIDFAVLAGPLTDQLLTFVADSRSDLLMVGHGVGHSGRRALARRLVMKAPCSVWMIPEGAPDQVNRILVPIDFSEHAADTMRVAVSLARARGAPCIALHVYFNEAVATYEDYDHVLRGEEQQSYDKFIAPLDTQGVTVTPHFEEGANVAHVILRVAESQQADLIVMGTRGRSRSAAILLGSVTEQTIIETRVPLLAVKHFGARMGVLQALLDRRFLYASGLHTD
jgi:nucleotide-binding universal stress UspA family protein